MQRRELLIGATAAASAAALGLVPASSAGAAERFAPRRPSVDRLPSRIAFGSCARQDKPQPIWEVVNELAPDLFIFLGDNIYGDTENMLELRAKYAQLGRQPGFRRLCERTPVLATWDDHDYGANDAGREYPMKQQSRQIFCDFWGEPAASLRRTRDGIYDAVRFSDGRRALQVLLPDLRFNRTPIRPLDLGGRSYKDWAAEQERAGGNVPGPYEREPDSAATMLGEAQWQWLEQSLAEPADLRILASSLQVVADFPGWEAWINYAGDHQRLLQAIGRARANGLFCISGDTHYGELSRLDLNAPYPLWDLTSSGLTEVWPVTPPNSRRIGEVLREINFGWLEIDWQSVTPSVRMQVRDARGDIRAEQQLSAAELRVAT